MGNSFIAQGGQAVLSVYDEIEGRDEEQGERLIRKRVYVYIWLIHIAVQKKPTQHCKAIILQLKINFKKNKKEKKEITNDS